MFREVTLHLLDWDVSCTLLVGQNKDIQKDRCFFWVFWSKAEKRKGRVAKATISNFIQVSVIECYRRPDKTLSGKWGQSKRGHFPLEEQKESYGVICRVGT